MKFISKQEFELIDRIAQRAVSIALGLGYTVPKDGVIIDIVRTHTSIRRLDLAALAVAEDRDIGHDVFGIAKHLDRGDNASLRGCFVPRYAI